MRIQHLPALAGRLALVAAPLFFMFSGLAIPALKSSDSAQLMLIAAHPTAWYLFTLFSIVGSLFLVPAAVALMTMTREQVPRTAIFGGGLLQLGAFVALIDSATQLVYWQMGSPASDRPQMLALLHRYENAPAASAIFMIGALALVVGSLLLAVALTRSKIAPLWASVLLPLGLVANIAAFVAGSRLLLIGSSLVLLVPLGFAALSGRLIG
ncbi:MAG: hypothetical protein ACXVZ1_10940, partial [Gaiellaceae bacterium]